MTSTSSFLAADVYWMLANERPEKRTDVYWMLANERPEKRTDVLILCSYKFSI